MATDLTTQPSESAPQVPLVIDLPGGNRDYFTKRFIAVYAVLVAILIGATVALVAFGIDPGFGSAKDWSSWRPPTASTSVMAKEIADHLAPNYRLADGAQIAAIVPSSPTVTSGTNNIAIGAIALHQTNGRTNVVPIASSATAMYTLCGLGTHCSIRTGTPSIIRGQLVHREGLEIALYTFKYVHGIESVIVFMPPAKGATATTVLYFQKSDLEYPLSRPLRQTLPLAVPPRSTTADTVEGGTIDALTYPHLYTSALTQLQPGGALLILTPIPVG